MILWHITREKDSGSAGMHTHEYQAKAVLREFGIPVPDFAVIAQLDELPQALDNLGLEEAVIKVQIHAGGRGKAGGVKIGRNRKEIENYTQELLGMRVVTKQTGKEGLVSHQVLVSAPVSIAKEY
jgi:succinyl-CoA synthetase beta subunit